MNDKLNPCPFCGGDDITVDYRETTMFERNDYVHCNHCGSSAKLKNWNDRPIECEMSEEIVNLQSRNDGLEKLVEYWNELHDIAYNLMDYTDSVRSLYLENKEKISNLISSQKDNR